LDAKRVTRRLASSGGEAVCRSQDVGGVSKPSNLIPGRNMQVGGETEILRLGGEWEKKLSNGGGEIPQLRREGKRTTLFSGERGAHHLEIRG